MLNRLLARIPAFISFCSEINSIDISGTKSIPGGGRGTFVCNEGNASGARACPHLLLYQAVPAALAPVLVVFSSSPPENSRQAILFGSSVENVERAKAHIRKIGGNYKVFDVHRFQLINNYNSNGTYYEYILD